MPDTRLGRLDGGLDRPWTSPPVDRAAGRESLQRVPGASAVIE
ncbi:MAG TPA: hypothetical protein VGH96_08890 [Streptosporangiaceae bacterium]